MPEKNKFSPVKLSLGEIPFCKSEREIAENKTAGANNLPSAFQRSQQNSTFCLLTIWYTTPTTILWDFCKDASGKKGGNVILSASKEMEKDKA